MAHETQVSFAQEVIESAWSKYPEAVVKFEELPIGAKKPNPGKLPKNVVQIYVRSSPNRPQRVYVFKGALEVTLTFKKGDSLENCARLGHLDDCFVLPDKHSNHRCTTCKEFTTAMYFSRSDRSLVCIDCFKKEG